MKRGEKAVLTCTADYAYGASGSPPKIPGGATLKFEVELFSWKSDRDLFGDGGVVKKSVEAKGGWKKPEPGNYCILNLVVRDGAGAVLDATFETKPLDIDLGPGSTDNALDKILAELKQGDSGEFTVAPPYKLGHGVDWPKSDAVVACVSLRVCGKVEDVRKDGSILKKILQEGKPANKLKHGGTVQASVTWRSGETVVGESAETIVLGDGNYPEALEYALPTMNIGELAVFTLAADLTKEGTGQTMTVEVTAAEGGKDKWEMSLEEKMAAAEKAKAVGNDMFRKGECRRARVYYEYVVKEDSLFKVAKPGQAATEEQRTEGDASRELRLSCLLNLAACQLKTASPTDVIETTTKAHRHLSCVT